jgi:hypothetical protein
LIAHDCVATCNRDPYDAWLKVMGSRFGMRAGADVMDIWNARANIAVA